ncbi:hypothetical protein F7725_011095 [Dissostichus mawsoni]|uniref:Uncharacterized protein n=1 Tax=Dissostichus mawsoni TaxID=36200 RepID=A0A7J5Z7V6_DISMA|nr:hypothetical protein F7725_011095 [Dissostichus mawsoni]
MWSSVSTGPWPRPTFVPSTMVEMDVSRTGSIRVASYDLSASFLWCRRLCFGPVHKLLLEQDGLVVLCQPAEYRPIRTALALPGSHTHKDKEKGCGLSSEDGPELLGLCSLRVGCFLDGQHLDRPAAHVLLRLDEGGHIFRLQTGNQDV